MTIGRSCRLVGQSVGRSVGRLVSQPVDPAGRPSVTTVGKLVDRSVVCLPLSRRSVMSVMSVGRSHWSVDRSLGHVSRSCWSVGRSVGRSVDRSCGSYWLVSGSVGGSVGRPVGRSVGWSVGRSVGRRVVSQSVSRLVSRSVGRSVMSLMSVGQSCRSVGHAGVSVSWLLARSVGQSVGRLLACSPVSVMGVSQSVRPSIRQSVMSVGRLVSRSHRAIGRSFGPSAGHIGCSH